MKKNTTKTKEEDKEDKEDKKIFGINIKYIPKGHPLRFIYPNKFR